MTNRCPQARRAGARPRRLRLEPLEDRRMLATLMVDTELDVVNAGDGLTSLREAIAATNSMAGADTIEFHPSLAGKTILLSQGELAITDAVTIAGLGSDLLTIDAQNLSRVLNIDDPGTTVEDFDVTLRDLTITRGTISGSNQDGGAIRSATTGELGLERCTVSESSTSGTDSQGGGIHALGLLRITDSVVKNNRVLSGVATAGGGIWGFGGLEMTNSTVTGNMTTGNGGGILIRGFATITDSTISNNAATSGGGNGGGITSIGSLTLVGSTVSGNRTLGLNGDGGGIVGGNNLVIRYSTITNNQTLGGAGKGGGIYSAGNLTVVGAIVAGNTSAATSPDLWIEEGHVVTINYSLVGNTSDSGITAATGTGNLLDADPKLGPLAHNGGTVQTHALLPASPARNMGDPGAAAGIGNTPDYDQRGLPFGRVYANRVDMGAVEYQPLATDFDGDGYVDGLDFLAWQIGWGAAPANRSDGDSNYDRAVDGTDLSGWEATYGYVAPRQSIDFNGDGDIDGLDFLAWQIGFGTTAPNAAKADGDSDNDGDVDAGDLAAWESAYGLGWELSTGGALSNAEPAIALAPQLVDLALETDETAETYVELAREAVVPQDSRARAVESLGAVPRRVADFGDIVVSRSSGNSTSPAAGIEEELVVARIQ